MFLVLLLIALILGVLFYRFELALAKKNDQILQESAQKILQHASSSKAYEATLQAFLDKSRFSLLRQEGRLFASHKPFSVGWLLLGTGFFFVGAILYLLYYLYWQKPRLIPLPSYSE